MARVSGGIHKDWEFHQARVDLLYLLAIKVVFHLGRGSTRGVPWTLHFAMLLFQPSQNAMARSANIPAAMPATVRKRGGDALFAYAAGFRAPGTPVATWFSRGSVA
jgi:hypothetical protein